MIKPIFIKEIKANYKIILAFCAVITMYSMMVVYMFNPDILETLNYFVETMPEIMGMMNMNGSVTNLLGFISNYLYGFLLLAFPLIIIVIISVKLVSKYVDNGSLSYYLNSKYTRKQIIINQYVVGAMLLILSLIYSYIIILISAQMFFPGEIDIYKLTVVHLGLIALQVFVFGLAFMISCICDETSKAYTWIISITTGSLLIQMLSGIGDSFSWLNNLSYYILFDTQGLLGLDSTAILKAIVLCISGIALAIYGMKKFIKRDLPL